MASDPCVLHSVRRVPRPSSPFALEGDVRVESGGVLCCYWRPLPLAALSKAAAVDVHRQPLRGMPATVSTPPHAEPDMVR